MEQIVFEPIVKDRTNTYATLPWVEKYRPKDLDHVLSHHHIVSMLNVYIKKRNFPHFLFYGPPGTGKTSTICATARKLYGDSYKFMVLELNASASRGVEAVRNKVHKFVVTDTTYFGIRTKRHRFKLVILDEVDAMTHDAQALLRKLVETYTYNVRFCLICNYIKKINPALQSRCTIFRFSPLSTDAISTRTLEIAEEEGVTVTPDGIESIIDHAEGDMRKVINTLQATYMGFGEVNSETVISCMGYPKKEQINMIVDSLLNHSFNDCHRYLKRMKEIEGISLDDIVWELERLIRGSITRETGTGFDTMDPFRKASILSQLRCIEIHQSTNTTDNIQLSGLISLFKLPHIRPKKERAT